MNKYQSRISQNNGSFYALVVRIDADGQENVLHGYKGRHFSTLPAAQKSTAKYIAGL